MGILYRYILIRVAGTAALATGILTMVLVMGNAFKRIFDLLVNHDVPFFVIMHMLLLLIPQVLTFTVPWGLLIGVLMVFGRLSHDNELTAINTAGIGLIPLIAPVILLSLVVSLFCFYNNASLAPRASTEFKYAAVDLGKNNPTAFLRAGEPITRFGGYRIYVDKKYGNTVEDIYLWELNDKMIPKRSIHAEKGIITADLEDMSLTITLMNAREEERPGTGQDLMRIQTGLRARQLPIRVSLRDLLDTSKIEENISINTLTRLGSRLFHEPAITLLSVLPVLTELQKRVAFSFAPFTFILLGIPLAIQFHRKETSIGIILSLLVVTFYYLTIILAMGLKNKVGAYPELIIWIPNVFFQILGFYLLHRANFKQH
jgi:lipopolysaccharide export system permease protein